MRLCYAMAENVETRFCFARWAKFAAFAAMCLDGTLKSCYNTNKEGNDRRSLPVRAKITAHSLRQGAVISFYL